LECTPAVLCVAKAARWKAEERERSRSVQVADWRAGHKEACGAACGAGGSGVSAAPATTAAASAAAAAGGAASSSATAVSASPSAAE
jgi:hypothetical protein